jgi:hypothetical protein
MGTSRRKPHLESRKPRPFPSEAPATVALPVSSSDHSSGGNGGRASATSPPTQPGLAPGRPSDPSSFAAWADGLVAEVGELNQRIETNAAEMRRRDERFAIADAAASAPLPHVYAQGMCEHPVQLMGIEYEKDTAAVTKESIYYTSCGNRRHSHCVDCSQIYQRDAWHVIQSGLADLDKPAMFITLTAPGMGRKRKDGTGFVSAKHHSLGQCICKHWHNEGDHRIGAPVDPDRFDYERAVSWNNASSELWADFTRRWRKLSKSQPAYLAVREHHHRGLVHFHILVRGAYAEKHITEAIEGARAHADGYVHKLGGNSSVELLPAGDVNSRRKVSNYLSKYLCKSLATEPQGKGRLSRHYNRMRGEALQLSRLRRPVCKWQRGHDTPCTCSQCSQARRYSRRAWEMLGFTGHVLTKSTAHGSKWGKTMGQCRADRAAFQAKTETESALAMEWFFLRAGYGNSAGDAVHARLAAENRIHAQRPPPARVAAPVAA